MESTVSNEDAPLELVRMALNSLPTESPSNNTSLMGILQVSNSNRSVSSSRMILPFWIQRLEEVLETNVDHSRRKLLYTFNNSDPGVKDGGPEGAFGPDSPSFDNSRISRHRSICMENQLELNESENDYYESIINELAEKLQLMKSQKEDLQSICNSLGERLQIAGKDNEEKLREVQARYEKEINEFKEVFELSIIIFEKYPHP
jgi:hypothetical protein